MNPIILASILGTVLVLTLIFRVVFKSRIRRIPSRSRYRIFAVLGGIGIAIGVVGFWLGLASGHMSIAAFFLLNCLLLGLGCFQQMRKLSREF
jgi:uncharacterized membrane protein